MKTKLFTVKETVYRMLWMMGHQPVKKHLSVYTVPGTKAFYGKQYAKRKKGQHNNIKTQNSHPQEKTELIYKIKRTIMAALTAYKA